MKFFLKHVTINNIIRLKCEKGINLNAVRGLNNCILNKLATPKLEI